MASNEITASSAVGEMAAFAAAAAISDSAISAAVASASAVSDPVLEEFMAWCVKRGIHCNPKVRVQFNYRQ